MTAVVALTLGVAAEVAGPVACLVDAGVIGTATLGPRSIGRLPWSWSHACRFRRRLPSCRRIRGARIGLCRVADQLGTLPRFHRDGTLTWSAHAHSADDLVEANEWLRWLAERDAKVAAVETFIVHHQPPMVEMRLRLCGPGQWSVKAERVAGSSVPIGVAPDPDTPTRLGGAVLEQPVRLGVVADSDDGAELPDSDDNGKGDGQRHPAPAPILPPKYRQRDSPTGADLRRPGSSGAA
jgi:hypothetical protein